MIRKILIRFGLLEEEKKKRNFEERQYLLNIQRLTKINSRITKLESRIMCLEIAADPQKSKIRRLGHDTGELPEWTLKEKANNDTNNR